MKAGFFKQLCEIAGKENVRTDEPMKQHTTFRIGGAADYFVSPQTTDQIKNIIELCKSEAMPWYVIGNGSNLLVSDRGFRGVIIQLFKNFSDNEELVMMNDVYEKFLKSSEEFIFAENKPEKSDIIFVPGNGYPQMAEKAAELFKKGMADWILPSGKYSVVNGKFSGVLEKSNVYDKEYGTEWEFLRDVLIKNGVPDQKILKEDQATFTYENAIYSRQVTDHAELEIERAILCCKSYHARRCLMYYQLLYPETEFYVVPVNADGITRENWKKNEEGIDAVTGELSRIVKQFSLMLER